MQEITAMHVHIGPSRTGVPSVSTQIAVLRGLLEEGKGASLKTILQTLEGGMSGGRVVSGKGNAQDGSSKVSGMGADVGRIDLNND